MTQWLQDHRIFVSGGASSIGRYCLDLFHSEGAEVSFLDVDEDAAMQASLETGARCYIGDIADRSTVISAIDDAAQKMGGLTGLINFPAGGPRVVGARLDPGPGGHIVLLLELTEDYLEAMLEVNVKGYYWATQAAIPHMLRSGKGSIVQFGTIGSIQPGWGEAYGPLKAVQTSLAFQSAMEYSPIIRSNSLICGWMEHNEARVRSTWPGIIEPIMDEHPQGRSSSFKELANVCLFLLSDQSMAVNGEMVVADGGSTAVLSNSKNINRLTMEHLDSTEGH